MSLPAAPNFRLDGRRALVTGGTRGIGHAAAVALAQAGAAVTIAARSENDLASVAAAFSAAGLACDTLRLDVTDSKAVTRAIAERAPFQILVNNAGMNRPKPLVEIPDEDIDLVFDLNVKAAFYMSREVAKSLLAAKLPGSMINVSSQMGLVGSPRRTLYCASKHALEGLTKALAWELGPANIRVNTLCPTFIETAMTTQMFKDDKFRNFVLDKIALGRLGQLEEVMGAIVFMASDASSLMTGSAVVLDGGWSAA